MSMYEEQGERGEQAPAPTGELFATCTPNSLPDAEGHVEHGFQICVLDDSMAILATIDLPDWETFRPASAGHRIIEHGYMIRADAREHPEAVNGWRRVSLGWMVPVVRLEQGEHDRQGDVAGVQPGGIGGPPGFASRMCPPGYIWLGDLSGMEVVPVLREGPAGPALQLRVTHRCGNEGVLMANMGMDGMSDDGAIMLGNLVEFAVKWREGHACPPHNPSPEHQARVQRWTDSASGGARPVVEREGGAQAGLLTSGPMTPVDLETEGQRLFRQGRHAEAEIPLVREILGDEAADQMAARRAVPRDALGRRVDGSDDR